MQIHGVRKNNLKTVIAAIANAGSSTLGGCGDINRNIMAPPAPLTNDPAYQYVFDTSNVIAELFRPSSQSFAELWLDGEKTATIEYWKKDLLYGATAKPGTTVPIPGRPQDIDTLEKQLEVCWTTAHHAQLLARSEIFPSAHALLHRFPVSTSCVLAPYLFLPLFVRCLVATLRAP